jgi:hypothetical protein
VGSIPLQRPSRLDGSTKPGLHAPHASGEECRIINLHRNLDRILEGVAPVRCGP